MLASHFTDGFALLLALYFTDGFVLLQGSHSTDDFAFHRWFRPHFLKYLPTIGKWLSGKSW